MHESEKKMTHRKIPQPVEHPAVVVDLLFIDLDFLLLAVYGGLLFHCAHVWVVVTVVIMEVDVSGFCLSRSWQNRLMTV